MLVQLLHHQPKVLYSKLNILIHKVIEEITRYLKVNLSTHSNKNQDSKEINKILP